MNVSPEPDRDPSWPMSRVARQIAQSTQEVTATAGLALPPLGGDAAVPPTKAMPVVSQESDDAV